MDTALYPWLPPGTPPHMWGRLIDPKHHKTVLGYTPTHVGTIKIPSIFEPLLGYTPTHVGTIRFGRSFP